MNRKDVEILFKKKNKKERKIIDKRKFIYFEILFKKQRKKGGNNR